MSETSEEQKVVTAQFRVDMYGRDYWSVRVLDGRRDALLHSGYEVLLFLARELEEMQRQTSDLSC